MIGVQEFQVRARIGGETLRAWVEASWLIPSREEPEPAFSEADVARARLIRDLTEDLGVNEDGVGVILDLVDQIHGLRRTLGDLVQAVRVQPEAVQREIAAAVGEAAVAARRDA
ncbi:MAG TPA: chaperone modulator CbpM [Geminicoccaceae bacterium]